MRFDLLNSKLKFCIALLILLPFNSHANHEYFSIEKFVKMGDELECSNSYEVATTSNMFTRDCMSRGPAKRSLTFVVKSSGRSFSNFDNACEQIQSELENEIQQKMNQLKLETNIISVTTIDYNFKGGKNKPNEVNCKMEIQSHQKDVRFNFKFFNETRGSDGFLSKADETSCQKFVEHLKATTSILALSGRINDNFINSLPQGCNVYGFEIGQDQVVEGKIKKF